MTRARWTLLAAVLVLALVATVDILVLRPQQPAAPSAGPSSTTTASPEPTSPPPWESTRLPGYDPDPGPFTLTPLEDATGDGITVSLALEPDAPRFGRTVGLSFDATELANPMWDSPESNLTLTLAELDRPVLRFGGNGVDRRMWWTSADEPAPGWADVTVTPEDLERVANVAEDVDAEVTLVLDLGHDDPARAADMAAHAQLAFGDRLLAVSIGNEPNGFFHENQPQLAVRTDLWGPGPYQDSLRGYSDALQEDVPGISVAGPGAYDATWWRAFAESGIPDQRALSMHWYPLWDCDGQEDSIANPTVEDLTAPAIRDQARKIVGQGVEVADEHNLPLWMEETGPTSCPGTTDVSRTHAQALWTVDYSLTIAELGVERIAFHSTLQACDGGAPMSPLCATGPYQNPGQIVEGQGSFLALMLLSQIPDGQVLTPTVSGGGTVMAHGVLGDDGSLSLLIVDLRNPVTADPLPVRLCGPSGMPKEEPETWRVRYASRLAGTDLSDSRSTLGASADVSSELRSLQLGSQDPITVTTSPGTVTALELIPEESASTGSGPSPD
ncbi:hypothetical protein [Brachybacterium aquaticum]|uniref:Uncharacterized protein n=1 Tax=Brachybacterium aquaticum TaxID=1432564 RepID=A0A841A5Z2_9MICO|nr:hypothetical protein [Brachybacterium aquaticum]MBB5830266.1 hypothetical protein [Brachybacterium aquaticum]